MSSIFSDVPTAPPIEVFALIAKFNGDPYQDKVNLSAGAYRDESGKPWVLPVVQSVEKQLASDETQNHEYLPIAGLPSFREAALKLLLGESSSALSQSRVEAIQCPGGSGCIRVCADFCKKVMKMDTVYVSKPTWPNHVGIFKAAGFPNIKEYRYWNEKTRQLDIDGMLEDLKGAPKNAVVILHACAHNPTGTDPSNEQWDKIADVCQEGKLMVLIDCAYQGFATGDTEKDAYVCRMFDKKGFEYFVAQSFSKNFGLYNERVGNLAIITKDASVKPRIRSQLELGVRQMYSNPPNHGAKIVATVLQNPVLFAEWKENVKKMAERIISVREKLLTKLRTLGTPGTWDHITNQIGMFSYTGLNPAQCEMLVQKYHIYVMKSGRINMCGLNDDNMDLVANAIHDVVQNAN